MPQNLRLIIFLLNIIPFVNSTRHGWTSEEFPDPRIPPYSRCGNQQSSYICDPNKLLSNDDRIAANRAMRHLHNQTSYSVGTLCQRRGVTPFVIIVNKIKSHYDTASNSEMSLFTHRIGQRYDADQNCHKDLIILISIGDQKTFMREGEGDAIPITPDGYQRIATNPSIGSDLRQKKYLEAIMKIKTELFIEYRKGFVPPVIRPIQRPTIVKKDPNDYNGKKHKPSYHDSSGSPIPVWVIILIACILIPCCCCFFICYCCKALRDCLCPCCSTVTSSNTDYTPGPVQRWSERTPWYQPVSTSEKVTIIQQTTPTYPPTSPAHNLPPPEKVEQGGTWGTSGGAEVGGGTWGGGDDVKADIGGGTWGDEKTGNEGGGGTWGK
jgi:hypothetical protein